MVEKWNSGTIMVEQCGGSVEQCGGTVKQSWWNSVVDSGTVMAEQCGGTGEH